VPFKAIQADPDRFIEEQYRPREIVIKEVKNMQKDDISLFLTHILGRQNQFGVEKSFRFRKYIKKKMEYPSNYPELQPAGRSKKKSQKDKGKAKSNNIPDDTTVRGEDNNEPHRAMASAAAAAVAATKPAAATEEAENTTAEQSPTFEEPSKKKSNKKATKRAAAGTAAEIGGNTTPMTRSKKLKLPKNVPKADAIAMEEAKKFLKNKSRRRR